MTRAMWIVGGALFVAMLASNLPAPLYELYRHRFGFSAFTLSAIFATYPIALVVTLVVFARLPDRIGRRATLVAGIAAAAAGALLFAIASDVWWLIAGRLAAAVAIGLVGAAGAPMLVELSPGGDRRLAALVATFALSLACGVAPFLSGFFAQMHLAPYVTPYALEIVLAIAAIAAVMLVPETRPEGGSTQTRLQLSASAWRIVAVASAASGIGWWIASLFVSLIPSYVNALLGVHDLLVQGSFPLLVFIVSPLVQMSLRGIDDRVIVRVSMAIVIVAIAGIVAAVPLRSVPLFWVATVIAGLGQGASFLGGQTMINHVAKPEERARVTALFYAAIYAIIGGGVLGMGAIASVANLFVAFAVVGAIMAAGALATILATPGARSSKPARGVTSTRAVE